MVTARRSDRIETGRHDTWMESDVRLVSGMAHGRTRIWTDRAWTTTVGALRVVAVDETGAIVAFTGERRFRVGFRPLPSAHRTIEWASALFGDDLNNLARLDVIHYRPPRRGIVDRVVERP
jgi:hypothetical protein